jgi:hypothetical protein
MCVVRRKVARSTRARRLLSGRWDDIAVVGVVLGSRRMGKIEDNEESGMGNRGWKEERTRR